jgi:hypothetical protein
VHDPTYVLLYVADPVASRPFWSTLLGREPVEASPGFVMYVLPSGLKIGLWKAVDVSPPAIGAAPRAVTLELVLPQAASSTRPVTTREVQRVFMMTALPWCPSVKSRE